MKIALVSEHANPLAEIGTTDAGGQNVHVAALASEFAKAGHTVCVYTRRDDAATAVEIRAGSGYVVRAIEAGPLCPIAKDALYAHLPQLSSGLADAMLRDRPDIVHAHFWMSGLAALHAGRLLDVPVVQTFHALGSEKRAQQGTMDTSPDARVDREIELARSVDRVIATTSAELFELCRMGANRRRIKVVPCGVDPEFFAQGKPFVRPRTRRYRIVTLSRLVARKGVDDVIAALAGLPDTELLIAGGDEASTQPNERERLAGVARAYAVADRVFFVGRLSRAAVPGFLRSADVLVAAAWYEPFGIVPLEAMACGLPVVATAVGGQKDTVVDGITGFHVPPHAPAVIANALRNLLASRELRRDLGDAGRRRVERRYRWNRVAEETVREYRALADREGAGIARPA